MAHATMSYKKLLEKSSRCLLNRQAPDGTSAALHRHGVAYFVFQLQAVVIFTQYKDFFRVSLISLCLKIFRGVARNVHQLRSTCRFTFQHQIRGKNDKNGLFENS